jgi:hypothetical protein
MGQQHNKAIKRRRRKAYLNRKSEQAKLSGFNKKSDSSEKKAEAKTTPKKATKKVAKKVAKAEEEVSEQA